MGLADEIKKSREVVHTTPKPNPRVEIQDDEMVFINDEKNIRKVLRDAARIIVDFPGFAHPDLIREYLEDESDLCPRVCFRHSCYEHETGKWIFTWMIQPDGRYWADEDGFGAENGLEIVLYAFLNDCGEWISPFRIDSINGKDYFGTDWEDKQTASSSK